MGPKGALGSPLTVGRRPLPLGTATLIDVEGWARLAPPPPLSELCHPCPSCPGIWRKERNSTHAGRGLRGARGCWVSTEKSDTVQESWKQAGGTGWDAAGQLNPGCWDSPGAAQWAPLCMGKEGTKLQEGGLPSALVPAQP